jgi:hypothetical protein
MCTWSIISINQYSSKTIIITKNKQHKGEEEGGGEHTIFVYSAQSERATIVSLQRDSKSYPESQPMTTKWLKYLVFSK